MGIIHNLRTAKTTNKLKKKKGFEGSSPIVSNYQATTSKESSIIIDKIKRCVEQGAKVGQFHVGYNSVMRALESRRVSVVCINFPKTSVSSTSIATPLDQQLQEAALLTQVPFVALPRSFWVALARILGVRRVSVCSIPTSQHVDGTGVGGANADSIAATLDELRDELIAMSHSPCHNESSK